MTNQRNPNKKAVRNRKDQPITSETEQLVRKYKRSAAYKKFKAKYHNRPHNKERSNESTN